MALREGELSTDCRYVTLDCFNRCSPEQLITYLAPKLYLLTEVPSFTTTLPLHSKHLKPNRLYLLPTLHTTFLVVIGTVADRLIQTYMGTSALTPGLQPLPVIFQSLSLSPSLHLILDQDSPDYNWFLSFLVEDAFPPFYSYSNFIDQISH